LPGTIGVVAVLIAGCGGSSANSAPPLTVSLSRAADVSSAAPGYKVAVTLRETVPSVGTINATGNGSFSPAAHQGTMAMQMTLPPSAGSILQLQMVLDKTTLYVKLPAELAGKIPGHKPWVYVNLSQAAQAAGIPGLGSLVNSSSSLTDPGQYLNFLRATSADTVKDLGTATVNGVQTTHYRAEVNLAKLPDAVPASQRQSIQALVAALRSKGAATEMPMDAWIDSAHLIRRVQTSFTQTVNGASVAIAMTENFLQYGPQPAPTVPNPSQATNLLSLAHSTS
jgi:hypothetical protein